MMRRTLYTAVLLHCFITFSYARRYNARRDLSIQSDLPTNWTSSGCYVDDKDSRTLSGAMYENSTAMTEGSCIYFCNARGFLLAGLEEGKQCWCGNDDLSHSVTASSSDCNMACSGNSDNGTELCGGSDRLNLFKSNQTSQDPITNPQVGLWSSFGCYQEAESVFSVKIDVPGGSSNMSVAICTSSCESKGYVVAGLEDGSKCFCGNAFHNQAPPAKGTDCDMSCKGNATEYCGAEERQNVYGFNNEVVNPATVISSSSSTTSSSSTLSSAAPSTQVTTQSSSSSEAPSASTTSSSNPLSSSESSESITSSMTSTSSVSSETSKSSELSTLSSSSESTSTSETSPLVPSSVSTTTITPEATPSAGQPSATTSNTSSLSSSSTLLETSHPSNSPTSDLSSVTTASELVSTDTTFPQSQSVSGSGSSSLVSQTSVSQTESATSSSSSASATPSWYSVGCYEDSVGARTLSQPMYGDYDLMTVELCSTKCMNAGYNVSGTEYHGECYCDTKLQLTAILASDQKSCNTPCNGNSTEMCGGPNRLSVSQYGIKKAASSTSSIASSTTSTVISSSPAASSLGPSWSYMGCYTDTVGSRTLGNQIYGQDSMMTPELCQSSCKIAGYTLSGVEYSGECYCDNKLGPLGKLAADPKTCSMACNGNATETCGGPDRLNIYSYGLPSTVSTDSSSASTGTSSSSSTSESATPTIISGWSSLGCYNDSVGSRTLGNEQYGSADIMTQELCQTKCQTAGFVLSGLEYASECYCDNAIKNFGAPASDGCYMSCNGNKTEFCGGPDRLNIFSFFQTTLLPTTSTASSMLSVPSSSGSTFTSSMNSSSISASSTISNDTTVVPSSTRSQSDVSTNSISGSFITSSGDITTQPTTIVSSTVTTYILILTNTSSTSTESKTSQPTNPPDSDSSTSYQSSTVNPSSGFGSTLGNSTITQSAVSSSILPSSNSSMMTTTSSNYTVANSTRPNHRPDFNSTRTRNSTRSYYTANSTGSISNYINATTSSLGPEITNSTISANSTMLTDSTILANSTILTGSTIPTDSTILTDSTSSESPSSLTSTVSEVANTTTSSAAAATSTKPAGWEYLGCYTDNVGARTLPEGMPVAGGMTIEGCEAACLTAHYSYAGLEYAGQCYCGNDLRNGGAPAPDGELYCNMACNGNNTQICGGPNRLSLYSYYNGGITPTSVASASPTSKNAVATALPTGWAYQGCYIDGANGRVMLYQQNDDQLLTVESCVQSCVGLGYSVAGMEYGVQCFCDNYIRNAAALTSDSDCDMNCGGSNTEKCGAGSRLSVYSQGNLTVLQVPKPQTKDLGDWKYQGCLTDDATKRTFPYRIVNMVNNNTASNCLSLCQEYGYPAGGMSYYSECYCGDASDITNNGATIVSESDCNTPCSGDPSTICGGPSRLSYYAWTGEPLYTWTIGSGSSAGQYEFLLGGVVIPLVTQQGINGKVTFLEKFGTGAPNTTGAYELDVTLKDDFTAAWRPMHVKSDVFCSASITLPDKNGRQLNVGGWANIDTHGLRFYSPDGSPGVAGTNDWEEDVNEVALQDGRWYPTAMIMANGSVLVVGGQEGSNGAPVPTLEILPQVGPTLFCDWLQRTDPYNLYPYLAVLPSGDIFAAYYNEARILSSTSLETVRTLPNIPAAVNDFDGGRTYPFEGTGVLMPQHAPYGDPLEFMVCGGSTPGPEIALDNCVSLTPEVAGANWTIERMPSKRVISCMTALPDGRAGFGLAIEPNLNALLYDPTKPRHSRFTVMANTTIARLYHSEAILLRDGRVLVTGSDPEDERFPQEYRVEVFVPPYLMTGSTPPTFQVSSIDWAYGSSTPFTVTGSVGKVSLMGAESSTHGNSMGQRTYFPSFSCAGSECTVTAPPNANICPPGWFQMFVLGGDGTPSLSTYVRIGGDPAGLGEWPAAPGFTLPGM